MEVTAGSQLEFAGGFPVINDSGLPDEVVIGDGSMREVASTLSRWVNDARNAAGTSTMFNRSLYTPPDNVYAEMRAARAAVRADDIVGGVAEITESFAFGGVKWEGDDPDETDIFNQLNRDLNLDDLLRKQWRDVYTYSSYVCAVRWGWREYKVRGETENGTRRKKKYRAWMPVEIRTIDPTKVVPIRHSPFGDDLLAWCATNGEVDHYLSAFRGDLIDPQMAEFFSGVYTPSKAEADELSHLGVDINNLLVINPEKAWRFTLTKPDYERFADVRMRTVFKLLDLKQQLVNADRAMLIGAANYILLLRKGDKDFPAQPQEMQNLKENFQFLAKLPVIISDHRLTVDIIAPKTDFVLQSERYDTIDTRLLSRLLGTLTFSSRGQRNETNVTLSKAVARGMQNRRHMMARALEHNIARAIFNHPRNIGVFDGEPPSLVFTPRNIELEQDGTTIQALVGLRSSRDLSRESILEYFGFDQAAEAQRMEIEGEKYDDVFKTQVPFSAAPGQATGPNGEPESPQASGGRGGRPRGGGDSTNNATRVRPQTESGNPSTGGS